MSMIHGNLNFLTKQMKSKLLPILCTVLVTIHGYPGIDGSLRINSNQSGRPRDTNTGEPSSMQ